MASDPAAELEHLAAAIRRCQRCRLHEGRTRAVPGEGPPGAEWVLLGEGPGAAEDRTGRPFVGPAGRLLTELLTEAGLAREAVFITNCVKCRPPANRPPRRDELETCTGLWLHRQLDLIGPRLVVLLGQVATRQLLGDTATVGRCHGTLRQQDGRRYFITYHPAAALRSPAVAAALRADFQILGGILAALRS